MTQSKITKPKKLARIRGFKRQKYSLEKRYYQKPSKILKAAKAIK